MEAARVERNLQREVVFRARRLIFSDLADFGGPPTLDEEQRQLQSDERAAREMLPVLGRSIASAGGPELLAAAFGDARDQWERRIPGLLAFGARTHSELSALAPHPVAGEVPGRASALFQVAASLLDWIGDEAGGGGELRAALPPDEFRVFCRDPRARCEIACRLGRSAGPAATAFAAILRSSLDLADEAGSDASRLGRRDPDSRAQASIASYRDFRRAMIG